MSLLKATLTLLTLLAAQISGRPPRIPGKEERERAAEGKDIGIGERIVEKALLSLRLSTAAVMLFDAAVSCAMRAPSSVLSRRILGLCCLDKGTPPSIYISPLFLVGVAATVLGSLIRILCFRSLGPFFTIHLALNSTHKLVTTGPYAVVRHPSYTGICLVVAGITMCEASAGSWWRAAGMSSALGIAAMVWWVGFVGYIFLAVARARKEDLMLRREFGEVWERYARSVPYRYVPGVI